MNITGTSVITGFLLCSTGGLVLFYAQFNGFVVGLIMCLLYLGGYHFGRIDQANACAAAHKDKS